MRSPLFVFALLLCAAPAHADVKYNAAVVPAVGYHRAEFGFDGSLAGSALFGENRSSAVAFGPRLELGTFSFSTFRAAVGPALHVPIEPMALGFSLHIAGARDSGESRLGVGGRALIGFRPFNHYGSYAATGGLFIGVDKWFGQNAPTLMLGAQLDAMWLSLPFLAIGELFRG